MSFARMTEDCNVYVFVNMDHVLECCNCHITEGWHFYSDTGSRFIEHLHEHRAKGYLVPDDVFEAIQAYIDKYGDKVKDWG